MSDVKSPAEELAGADDTADAKSDAEETTKPVEPVEAAEAEPEAALDLPEGVNLIQMLIEAQQEAQTNKDGWQRARAEFANYKKRLERERGEQFQRAALDTLKSLLPIIDDFDLAFANVPEAILEDPWSDGVAMIQRKFTTLLGAIRGRGD